MEKEIRKYKDEKSNLLLTMEYVNGIPEGESVAYNAEGKIVQKSFYRQGKLDGELSLFNNQKLTARLSYKNDHRNGLSSYYNQEEKLIGEEWYEDDLKQGKSLWKFPSGKPMFEENYDKGILHGEKTEYHENGNLKKRSLYEKGKLVKVSDEFDEKGKNKTKKKKFLIF